MGFYCGKIFGLGGINMRKVYRLDIDNRLVIDKSYSEKASLYDCYIDLSSRQVRMPKLAQLQSMTDWVDARFVVVGKVSSDDKKIINNVAQEWAKRMRMLISLKYNKLACLDRASGWIVDNSLTGTAKCNLKIQIGSGGVKFAY